MNLKVRFTILFASFVSLILLISTITIYLLYSNFRVQEFYRRINKETLISYNLFIENKLDTSTLKKSIAQNELALIDFYIGIYDSNKKNVYHSSNKKIDNPSSETFKETQTFSESRFSSNGRESLILYFADKGYFVHASAYDKYGLRKLKNIQYILTSVLFGGILLSIIAAFVFVRHAFKPLVMLSNQMLEINEVKNAKPVIVNNVNDEIGQIAQSYNAMIERLKQTFEYQSVFVNHASHELRTPLAVMLSQTEAALNNQLNEVELRKVLLSLKDDQQGIIELTNSLLLLSQYEKNDDRLGWENIRLDELVYECMAIAKKVFPKIEISFNFIQIPEEMDLVIFANKSLLATALKNLIKNGYQYSYDKQININLLVNKLVAEITVENNGKEVPEEQREQLFQPFFRAKNVDMEMGYGLGLAIVQRIVQAHYGKIIYKVCDTGRNCFTIVLQKQKPVE